MVEHDCESIIDGIWDPITDIEDPAQWEGKYYC
jgi:hypothetical protein